MMPTSPFGNIACHPCLAPFQPPGLWSERWILGQRSVSPFLTPCILLAGSQVERSKK